jgi:hypothetical protein
MTIGSDIEAMLDRAIADVFHGEFVTRDVVSDGPTWIRGLEVISRTREDRIVIIRAGRAWIGAFIPQLGIGAAMVDEDDDIAYKEEELRKLCRALHSYLEGAGRVTQRRRPFGRDSTSELAIEVDGFEWRFGHRSWVWAHPV